MIVTISYQTRLQLKWNSSDHCHVRGSVVFTISQSNDAKDARGGAWYS